MRSARSSLGWLLSRSPARLRGTIPIHVGISARLVLTQPSEQTVWISKGVRACNLLRRETPSAAGDGALEANRVEPGKAVANVQHKGAVGEVRAIQRHCRAMRKVADRCVIT